MRSHTKSLTILLLTFLTITAASEADAQRGPRGAAPGGQGAGFPTVDVMADAIDANPAQRAALAEARLAFLEAMKARREDRGPRGRHGGHAGPPASPMGDFLSQVAPLLDTQETIALVDLFAAQAPGRRAPQMRGDRRGGQGRFDGQGPRGGQGPGAGQGMRGPGPQGRGSQGHGRDREDMLIHQLDLSAEQKDQVEALYGTTLGALTGLRRQAVGEPTDAQRAEADRIRAEHQARLEEILSDAQNSELMKLRAERRMERSSEGAERRVAMQAKRLDDMALILDLSGSQKAAVEKALQDAETKAMVERGERMAKGGPMPHLFDQGQGAMRELRDETRAAITDVLEPAQRELFAKIQALRLEARGPGGQGHAGHGPRGGGQR